MELSEILHKKLTHLNDQLDGELFLNNAARLMYATDASVYRELPLGVARPRNREDIRKLILFARDHGISLIPRAAGTSLAGQVVGPGLIVDVSRYMTTILELNTGDHWIRVEPGVILDELNRFAAGHGLFFGPETSTSSRCMIGGMVGNNSCGAHSNLYGSTRDHLVSVKAFLSDGSEVEFTDLSAEEVTAKMRLETLEGKIYRHLTEILSNQVNRENIRREFPDPSLHRRNTGYAIDLLLEAVPVGSRQTVPLNLSKLLAGSEGTLAFITEIKLNLVPLPPKEKALVCIHCRSVKDALNANLIALKYNPGCVELMDKAILDCTKENITQRKNRFFLEGDPGAVLIVEFARDTQEEIIRISKEMEVRIRDLEYGYAFPLIFTPELNRVWALRKAGLGVLANYPGDRKPVAVTEDTAVAPGVLPGYIEEFDLLMEQYGLNCVHHAHAGSGELHLRPVLNLKNQDDVELFHTLAFETAKLVKKYRGSLSGEHGDGRLRGEFIPQMIGEENYQLLRQIKYTWDPQNVFNPGKIVDTPPMNTGLRYPTGKPDIELETLFDFSDHHGILRAAEQCNGSGECRNIVETGVWMCPSYMATKEESTTTRARANILREFLTHSPKNNPFDHPEIFEVMDLCLMCKACKSECPSNVDMAKLKGEFLQHWYDANGVSFRSWLIAKIASVNALGMVFPVGYNFMVKNRVTSSFIKSLLGFNQQRNLPEINGFTLTRWINNYLPGLNASLKKKKGSFYLFVDEFTNYQDVPTGISFLKLFHALGYEILTTNHTVSARTFLSKGLLRSARKIAIRNVKTFLPLITPEVPLVGIEPSAILGFRDEYPDLVGSGLRQESLKLSYNVMMVDEFFMRQVEADKVTPEMFTQLPAKIKLHGHCHQKALASLEPTVQMLSLPVNYTVKEIPSGCCGMAGAFGYEKEHYDVSMKVGELVLFPEIRKVSGEWIISAPGISCRQQILDGTRRKAYHPVEVIYNALKELN